eukprot:4104707-Amphidinium_carterae.1
MAQNNGTQFLIIAFLCGAAATGVGDATRMALAVNTAQDDGFELNESGPTRHDALPVHAGAQWLRSPKPTLPQNCTCIFK